MERFQVSITKLNGDGIKSILKLDVKQGEINPDTPTSDVEYKTVAILNLEEPRVEYVRFESLGDGDKVENSQVKELDQPGVQLASTHEESEEPDDESKKIHILHVHVRSPDEKKKSSDGEESGIESSEQLLLNSPKIENEDDKWVRVNIRKMKTDFTITTIVDPNKLQKGQVGNSTAIQKDALVPSPPIPSTSNLIGTSDVINYVAGRELSSDEKTIAGNLETSATNPTVEPGNSTSKQKIVDKTSQECVKIKRQPSAVDLANNNEDIMSQKTEASSTSTIIPATESPTNIVIAVANKLLITLEIDHNPRPYNLTADYDSIGTQIIGGESLDHYGKWAKESEPSEESILEPGTTLEFPWANKETNPPNPSNNSLKVKQREARKKLLKSLIHERLLAFGLPYDEAHNITDAWNTGYVHQRVYSYRVPTVSPKWKPPTGLNPSTEEEVKAGAFAYNFLRHIDILQGTLDGATCTVIEATFFLMLPHFKVHNRSWNANQLDSLTSTTFVKDWIQVIFTAAYQLKPSDPGIIAGIVAKETKLLRKLLKTTKRTTSKIKGKIHEAQENIERLRKKVLKRIEPNPEWTEDIFKKDKEKRVEKAMANKVPGAIQIPEGLTAGNLFENYIHVSAGKKGLVIKRHLADAWYSFSNLTFLERRVIFLGLTDHMYSTFDTILCTLRHLQELYTTGYPLNIFARIAALFEQLRDKHHYYKQLSPQIRSMIYTKVYELSESVDRFVYTFSQLAKLTKDAGQILQNTWFNPTEATEFISGIAAERLHIHLIVPFTTLSMSSLSDLKSRGRRTLSREKEKSTPPPTEVNNGESKNIDVGTTTEA